MPVRVLDVAHLGRSSVKRGREVWEAEGSEPCDDLSDLSLDGHSGGTES